MTRLRQAVALAEAVYSAIFSMHHLAAVVIRVAVHHLAVTVAGVVESSGHFSIQDHRVVRTAHQHLVEAVVHHADVIQADAPVEIRFSISLVNKHAHTWPASYSAILA